jgi:hypothetical protein
LRDEKEGVLAEVVADGAHDSDRAVVLAEYARRR